MAASSTSFFSVTAPLHLATPRSSRSSRSTVSMAQPQAGNSKTVDIAVPSLREEGEGEDEWYEVPVHRVTVRDRQNGVSHSFEVPEDQYILQTGEDQQINLPFSCRHGCCTACAVRVKSGQLYQPQALGISAELKEKGYGLLCVGYPLSDLEVETQDEDEVYWLQFGQYFARGPLERDDFALELAVADE